MRLSLSILFLFVLSLNSQQPKSKTQQPQQTTTTDQRGTQESPILVKVLPTPKTSEEATQDAEDRKQKAKNDGNIVDLTAVLAIVAFLQLLVYTYQAKKLRETVESAGQQAEAMERHIGEATRSANAMEHIATVIQSGNAAVLRAYISVVIGEAVYQDLRDGLKFEGKPNLVNTGSTPAHNVRTRISAALVPQANAENFDYTLPEEVAKGSAVVAPHQTYILRAMVKEFVPEVEVSAIKHGEGKALTVWGVITYDDIFGTNHTTKFAQWLFWNPNNSMYGYYIPGQNEMS